MSRLSVCLEIFITVLLQGDATQSGAVVPDTIKPAANQHLVLQGHATGDQIYVCKAAASGFAWVFSAPEAKLVDDSGKEVAKHFAGPTWQSGDGSLVKGKMVSQTTPDPDSIPWLLLTAVGHSGDGIMSGVGAIQRVNTKGGKAPATGCDAQHQDEQRRVSYTADYYFYSSSK
jgi:hypothetical protein